MARKKIKWEEANFTWEFAPPEQGIGGDVVPYTWDDVRVVDELLSQGASVPEIAHHIEQLDPEKKRRFIKLVCKVKGIETYSGQKTIKSDDIKITVEDIELVVKEVLGIDLTVENINAR
tara:strand:+ start:1233 stop:1589 length:357 start_codon:yes stop_codon:yes gene_type:complete